MKKHRHRETRSHQMATAFGQFLLMNRLEVETEAEGVAPATCADDATGCGYSRHRGLLMSSLALLPFSQMDLIGTTPVEASLEDLEMLRDRKKLDAVRQRTKDRSRKRHNMQPHERHHTAILLFRELTHRYPNRELIPGVINVLGERPDRTWLVTCYHEWLKRGYRPLNLAWLFEWYAQGKIPSGPVRRRDVGASQPAAAPVAVAPPENETMPLSEILRIVEEHESKTISPEPRPFKNEDMTTDEVLRIVEEHERTK